MTDGQVLEFSHATKRFGVLTAVDDLSARIEPGAVTAFLGPNGAGKTTSLRMLLGQIRPTSGTTTVGGVPHAELRHPLRTIGSVLEEAVYRPRRTAPRQLSIAARANGIPLTRVDEVLGLVGLQNEAETRIGAYSLGMRQRLSVAGALLGDPGVLVLDEPANGLDPEGIRWMRLLMRRLADEGRTVLVSSHVLSEIEQIADNVLVLNKGRLMYADRIDKLADPTTGSVVVDADDRAALSTALAGAGLRFDVLRSGLTVLNTDAAAVGAVAAAAGVALTTLQQRGPSLEEVFLDLVHGRRAPMTGAIPIVSGASASDAPGGSASADAAESAAQDTGAELGGGATAGAAGAVAAGAVAAGVAGLFASAGSSAPVPATVAIPTTRREAAEFAAAQATAQAGGAADAEPRDEAAEASAEGAAAAVEGADEPLAPADGDGEGAFADSEGAAADGEGAPTDGEAVEQGESAAADGETVGNEADAVDTDGTAPDADTDDTAPDADADQADSTDAHESAEADSEHAGADSDGAEETEGPDGSVDEGRDDLDETTAVEGSATPDGSDDHGADDADAESAQDEAAEPSDDESGSHDVTDEHDKQADGAQEAESIAVGVALTAPIESGYTPGEGHPEAVDEAGSTEAETDEAGSDAEQEASLTHEPGEAGSALGSFETAALTIPEQAPSISFDDLITGVPQMVRSDAEHVPDESETDAEDDANAPTAATAIIRTPAADDEAAEQDPDQDAEPSTETTEIAGIEIFSALNEGRTQEIQVILDSADEEDDDLEDVTQGEIAHDEDPRAAAVSASLAAAARAFFSDDAPDYTPGPTEGDEAGAHDDERSGSDSDAGEHVDGDHHDRGEGEHDRGQDQHGHDEHHG